MAKKSVKKTVKKGAKKVASATKKVAKKAVKKVTSKKASKKAAKKVSGKKKVAKKATKKAAKKGMPKVAHDRPLDKNEVPTSNDGEVPGAPHFDMVEPPLTRDAVAVEVDGPETYDGEIKSENESNYTEAEIIEDETEEDEDDFKGANFGEDEF